MGRCPLSTRGRLLVASPDLVDPNFRRTVILMLTHDAEGAVGLVLNRPTDIAIGEALPQWRDATAPPACLYVGGPVQPDAAIGLGFGGSADDDPVLGAIGAVDLDGSPDAHRGGAGLHRVRGMGTRPARQRAAHATTGSWSTPRSATCRRLRPRRCGVMSCAGSAAALSLLAHAPEDASLN